MSSLCARVADPCTGEKGSGSASIVGDADWASREPKMDTQELGVFSADSDGVVLSQWRKRILDVAEEHIRRIGHRKTTVSDIASDLGISRANVYRFFPTRAAIDQGVCARIANRTLDIAREVTQTDSSAGIKLAEVFVALHRDTKLQLAEERHVHELFVAATDGRWEVATKYFGEITKIIESTIREGLKMGELQADDAGKAARCIMAAIAPFVHPSLVQQRAADGDDLRSELEAQTQFILRALAKVPGCPSASEASA